jgi:hypothetical protein
MALTILAIWAFGLRQLWIGWQTVSVDSRLFWLLLLPALQVALVLSRLPSSFSAAAESGALRQRVQVVRRALLAGDTRLAPLAAAQPQPQPQPQPLDQAASGGESLRIGPLRPLADTQLTLWDVCGSIVLTFGFLAAILAAILIGIDLTQPQARNNPPL